MCSSQGAAGEVKDLFSPFVYPCREIPLRGILSDLTHAGAAGPR
ncbi:hypothetical protein F750_6546 [Streptomyces sp. PAMC 26508]|nr:hypothetical protein F750_6546 [Streptomyces sp. PAMC 26508]